MKRIHRTLMFFGLLAAILGSFSAPVWAAPDPQELIILGMDPLLQPVTPGAEFLVTVYVDSGPEPFDGVQITLAFDPNYLQVIEIIPDDDLPLAFPFPPLMPKGYSNSEGRISFTAGAALVGDIPTGRLDVLTVRFQARSPTTGTLIQFIDDQQISASAVVRAGYPLDVNLMNIVITVVPDVAPTATLTRMPLILKPWPGDR